MIPDWIEYPVAYRERDIGRGRNIHDIQRAVVDANENLVLIPLGESVQEIRDLGEALAQMMNEMHG